MNNVRILKGGVGHKWLRHLPTLVFTWQKLSKIKYINQCLNVALD